MTYRFAVARGNYADFAGGQVFHSAPGFPAYPARLAFEIFRRCAALLESAGLAGPYSLYDPCCGGGHLLTTLGYLCGDQLSEITGSDFDPDAVQLAERNLRLLTLAGLDARIAQIAAFHEQYGKESHAEALNHAASLRHALLERVDHPLTTHVFRADATDSPALSANLRTQRMNIVVTDVPYGRMTVWQDTAMTGDPMTSRLLEALRLSLTAPASPYLRIVDRRCSILHIGGPVSCTLANAALFSCS